MSNDERANPSGFNQGLFRPDPDALAGKSRAELIAEDVVAPDLSVAVERTVLFEGFQVRRTPLPTSVYPNSAGSAGKS